MLVGNPEEVSEQLAAYSSVGLRPARLRPAPGPAPDEILELLELFGDQVIPEHDPDPVHSTDHYRATAVPKYGKFSDPLPDIEWPTVLPVTATLTARTARDLNDVTTIHGLSCEYVIRADREEESGLSCQASLL